jgi:hypothetical protein
MQQTANKQLDAIFIVIVIAAAAFASFCTAGNTYFTEDIVLIVVNSDVGHQLVDMMLYSSIKCFFLRHNESGLYSRMIS